MIIPANCAPPKTTENAGKNITKVNIKFRHFSKNFSVPGNR